ncbi:hypothetical protein SSX86_033148 [Deinandra increscens subsp. villosa]|uniref:Uncharacterized protein n=1 Tax=Deinandra increscens subsp. villosa TaxID=3103831 RepID=A0AAP0C2R2_9ASTR
MRGSHLKGRSVYDHNVFYAPSFDKNILSATELCNQGFEVTFEGSKCYLTREREVSEDTHSGDTSVDDDAEKGKEQEHFKALDEEISKNLRGIHAGKGKEIVLFTPCVNSMDECMTFMDLLKIMWISAMEEDKIKDEFGRAVKWFNRKYLKQKKPFPAL